VVLNFHGREFSPVLDGEYVVTEKVEAVDIIGRHRKVAAKKSVFSRGRAKSSSVSKSKDSISGKLSGGKGKGDQKGSGKGESVSRDCVLPPAALKLVDVDFDGDAGRLAAVAAGGKPLSISLGNLDDDRDKVVYSGACEGEGDQSKSRSSPSAQLLQKATKADLEVRLRKYKADLLKSEEYNQVRAAREMASITQACQHS
jgi:hypothetical protein